MSSKFYRNGNFGFLNNEIIVKSIAKSIKLCIDFIIGKNTFLCPKVQMILTLWRDFYFILVTIVSVKSIVTRR